jgi:hypothetical protein
VSPRVFLFLLLVTVGAIWVGDTLAEGFSPPGLQRTFAVLVIAAAIVAPVAWLLERLGFIRKEKVELGRRKPATEPRDGGAA